MIFKSRPSKAKYGTTVPYKRIHINEDGTFTDILTGKVYNTSATNGEDVIITGKANHWKEAGKIINNKQTPSEILSTSVEDNPIMQLSYYKPTRKAWSTGKAEGNKATSYFFKQQPNQRFELVKDIEPNNYSVHFKTDRNGLNYGNKM